MTRMHTRHTVYNECADLVHCRIGVKQSGTIHHLKKEARFRFSEYHAQEIDHTFLYKVMARSIFIPPPTNFYDFYQLRITTKFLQKGVFLLIDKK